MEKSLSETSIIGRFSIGLYCIENSIKRKGLFNNHTVNVIIAKLSEFIYTNNVKWVTEIQAYLPKYFKTTINDNITEEFYNELINFYKNINYKDIFEIIELCSEIALNHMYGGIIDNSPETIKLTQQILEKTGMINEFDFKKISKNHPMTDNNKWGVNFNYNHFKPK
ncbi:hypothetical protein LNI95_11850 [Tenacibaculum dicentrarchi]|uniref:hypothetical protein n=1 Tax=Tenacibaculum finnmarkense TaxID=2781243 RepID=UPI001E37665D|nr:hypothetical protein [Tenacibaculum finnmarkense]MCD8438358.1 hypothetical protein [Tenacibaculum dicentrarchi]WBX67919.1 hypothetical protein PG910_07215 [Tenacibaculum dicentrarchi]WCC46213.1 hypothetical protein PJH08_07330 [Tenacibaculum finnmarkense]